jgi:2-C-methyl-D-erythritol 4-phosphate cytidylyltransferase/2-C-methyl-D-erythritol 2,4-cyclodiphosphate synthase
MHVTAIIAAGGRGQRFGAGQPKQLQAVGGRAILERTVALFLDHPAVSEVVVALPADLAAQPPAYLMNTAKPLRIVSGGVRRQDSVANAFAATSAGSDVIVIHDAARPFASAQLIMRTIEAAAQSGAAVAALPARDTVKRAAEGRQQGPPKGGPHTDSPKGGPHAETRDRAARTDSGDDRMWDPASAGFRVVAETLPRESIFLAQTPQAFRRVVLQEALALAAREGLDATDESALAERAGHQVRLVAGEPANIKITMPEDLAIAEAIAGSRTLAGVRAGVGYDLHRLVEGRPLILGGVTIPYDRGLLGHSDADALCHAVTEAILGAAAAGDIGHLFPDTDAQWKDASSVDLLRRAAAVVRERGLDVANVDASVIAERPRLAPFIETMRANLAAALGIDVGRVSVKGKTNEGVGAIGRGEAIAVHATACLHAR